MNTFATPPSDKPANKDESRLKHFPVSWFSSVMGLTGLSMAWNRAEYFCNPGLCVSSILLNISSAWFFFLALVYLAKIIKYPAAVSNELKHPVKQAFVPTISISLLMLSVAYLDSARDFSFWLWSSGTALHVVLTIYILSSWMHHSKYEITHSNPAWFIPVVGNIFVPIAGVQHGAAEISWFFFSLGIFFWPLLSAILFYRLIFHPVLPERLRPTLFIFIAPPSVGLISWLKLTGSIDASAHILYSIGLAFTLLLLSQINHFRKIPFYLSWWAYSFPMAAITIASFLMAQTSGQAVYSQIGNVLLTLLSLLITLLVWRTAQAVIRHEICVADH